MNQYVYNMEKNSLNLILTTLCIVFGGIIMYDMMTRINMIEGLETISDVVPPVEPAASIEMPIPERDGTKMTESEKDNQRIKIESANAELLKASRNEPTFNSLNLKLFLTLSGKKRPLK